MDFLNHLADEHQAIVVIVLTGAVSVLVAGITTWALRKKNAADVAKQLTDIAMGLIDPLQEEIDELKKEQLHLDDEIALLKGENALLHRWSQLLFSQVVESGGEPISFEQVQEWAGE